MPCKLLILLKPRDFTCLLLNLGYSDGDSSKKTGQWTYSKFPYDEILISQSYILSRLKEKHRMQPNQYHSLHYMYKTR